MGEISLNVTMVYTKSCTSEGKNPFNDRVGCNSADRDPEHSGRCQAGHKPVEYPNSKAGLIFLSYQKHSE